MRSNRIPAVSGPTLLLAGLIAFLCYWLLFPMGTLIMRSLSDENGVFVGLSNFLVIFQTPGLFRAVWHTLVIGVTVMCITVTLAFIVAYGLTRARILGSRTASAVCMLPLFAPSLFPAVGLIYLFGAQGIANEMLFGAELQGPVGIVLGCIIYCLPHAVVLCLTTLRSIDPNLYEAARTLGVGSWKRFYTITLPHARHGIVSAALVVFILTITDFGVPKVLGGDYSMLATEIYTQVLGMHNFALGASISLVLMLPSLVAFYIDSWARKKQSRLFSRAMERPIERHGRRDAVFSILVWSIMGAQITVFAMVVWGSFINFWPYDLSLTLLNYDFSVMGGSMLPFMNSVILAFGVAVIGPVVMFLGVYCISRCPVPGIMAGFYRVVTLFPLSIPGTVLGLAYIFAFNRSGAWYDLLHGSVLLLVLNTTIHFYTVGHLTFSAALQKLNPEYETVGFMSGVPRHVTFFRVICPLGIRSLIEVSLYMFVNALTTISAVVFLYTPSTMPASVFMLQINETGNTAAAAAAGTVILGLAFGARLLYALLLHVWDRRARFSR